jgi:3'5'-cyclic nucleotide phosphodiesterase
MLVLNFHRSVLKLICRIVSPLELLSKQHGSERRLIASKAYDRTFGLASDPLTLLACAFSALIQSVDHPGVSNSVLLEENGYLAKKFDNKSITEQNSIEIAWNLFMADTYIDLRAAMFSNLTEQDHFRQIVVHCVLATDMLDPNLKHIRNQQWKCAFGSNGPTCRSMGREMDNRKAAIVIGLLMQTSNVAHTMQHVSTLCLWFFYKDSTLTLIFYLFFGMFHQQWHIYRKWNEKFYRETLVAFLTGRTEYDPSIDWYQKEIQSFDFTIIPLAKKLKECGVFGVSGHEYLNYALNNRKEWESTGKEIVAEMSDRCRSEIMAEIMKQMKANQNPGTQQPHPQLQCAISDQFGPDSLLLTSLWSTENDQSLLGSGAHASTSDKDDDDESEPDLFFDQGEVQPDFRFL